MRPGALPPPESQATILAAGGNRRPNGRVFSRPFVRLLKVRRLRAMASGFLVLPDGRCFAPRWSAYDATLRAVAAALDSREEAALRAWLLGLLPGPDDEEHV